MKKTLVLAAFLAATLTAVGPCVAAPSSVEAVVQALVTALNAHDYDAIEPHLARDFGFSGHGGGLGRTILRQVVAGYPKTITRHQIRRVHSVATGLRAEVVFHVEDGSAETHDILLTSDFELLQADVVQIQLAPHDARGSEGAQSTPDPARNHVPDRMSVDFDLVGRLIVVDAQVAGRPGRFIVDSGAPQALTLNTRLFADLADRASAQSLHGASGRIASARSGRLPSFRWQALQLADVEVSYIEMDHLEASTGIRPLSGLIGYGVLERFLVDYDYAGRKLDLVRLDADGEPVVALANPEVTVPVEMMFHLPVVTVSVGGRTLRLGIDSGAGGGMLQTRWREELADAYEVVGTEQITSADTNRRTAQKVRFSDLEVGRLSYPGMTFQLADLRFSHEVRIDGLLGYGFLSRRRTAINFRKGELYLGRQRADES